MSGNDSASYLWEGITSAADLQSWNIESFRQPGKLSSRLASWEPKELTLRWYRSFLNLAFSSSSEWVRDQLSEFDGQLNLGAPIENKVDHNGKSFRVNLDYLLTFEELEFVLQSLDYDVRNVCEVGAGFGRFAHLSVHYLPTIETYTIVDLPEILELSKSYLAVVLPSELFAKLVFVSPDRMTSEMGRDLSIQVDGLQEMTAQTVDRYMELFSSSKTFYSKNVVAKYLPSHGGIDTSDSEFPHDLGRSRRVLDIWNLSELEGEYAKHLASYTPINHLVVQSRPCRLFPHYLNFVSRRNQNLPY